MQVFAALAARRAQRGLTLIEACIALAVVAVLAGAAAPSFDGVLKSKRMEGQAGELAIDLRYVRSEAVSRNEGVRIRFQTVVGGTCTVIHTGAATDCSCGAGGVAQCSNGAAALKTVFYPAGGVAIQSNVSSMRFDPSNGTVTPAATIRVVGADGRAIHHVVNMVGRVRSCSSGAAVAGLKAC
jgi:type IV fimbrial biogenesis protein FimT